MTLSRRLAALLLAGLAFPPGLMAEESLGWYGHAYEDTATLFYGIAQSDHAEIAFSCQAGSDAVSFVFAFAPIEAVAGVEVEVTLEAGDISLPVHTTGILLEMDDQFLLEGQLPLDARLINLLSSDGMLSVFVEDGVGEYPLDGAREAAAALIETCGPAVATDESAAIIPCEIEAWVEGTKSKPLAIRAGPTSDSTVIGHIPEQYSDAEGTFFTEVSITGAQGDWFRIGNATIHRYSQGEPQVVFEGAGWVPGHLLHLYVESFALYERPARNTPVAARFDPASADDYLTVDRVRACRGRWVEIDGHYAGNSVSGWSNDTCASQVTTCS